MTEAEMGSTASDSAGAPEARADREEARMRERAPLSTGGPGGDVRPEGAVDPGGATTPVAVVGTPVEATGPDADTRMGPGTGADVRPGPGHGPDAPANGPVTGSDAVVDLVLDPAPGEDAGTSPGGSSSLGVTSASVSVPAVGVASGPAAASDVVPAEGPGLLLGAAPAMKPGFLPNGVAAAKPELVADGGTAGKQGVLPGGAPLAEGVAPAVEPGLRPSGDCTAGPAADGEAVPVAAGTRPAPVRGTPRPARTSSPSPSPFPSALASPLPSPSRRRDVSRQRDVVDRARGGVERPVAAPSGTGRRHAVIGSESTATIPVHLLFRDDPGNTDTTGLPTGALRRGAGGGGAAPGGRRPPAPRGPQVRPSTRPAPAGDPELAERSGPALPGWVALLAALCGTAGAGAVLWWIGALPVAALARFGIAPRPYEGIGIGAWAGLAALATLVLFALGGLSRGRVGYAWVLTLFGKYRGSVRRTGLMWISPLLLRRRVDVRLRHWRSEPLPAVDANGTALRVVVLVVWRVRDTARALLGVEDHETYLREQVEAAMARVLSQLPADAFHEDAPTLRDAEAVGDALTRMLKADCVPVGIEVYSAQPTGIEYAPEIAAAMQRRRIAAIDAKHRDSVLTSVVDAVDDTVNRLTQRGIVELDDYERKVLVKDLTVAFYTGRGGNEGV
ncbi:SPFH domain-containing protein [Streptomyces sp. CB01580]|uniref:SPFH domain-containing protein n=1 Tax=Streptomyces sp. CB01580 TaxID=1703933 RepID=UPI001F5BA873|nr:SPFH domain-containing protein [Streptomyces sp. CB01580]